MKFTILATIAALAGSTEAENLSQKRCIALAMSGGGSKGAYEAGGLWGMLDGFEDKSDMEYDVVTGVSAGSINTLGVSVFAKGDERAMVEDLSKRWATQKQNNLFTNWFPLGPITGLVKKSGVLNTEVLGNYFRDFLGEFDFKFHRKMVISAVDVNSGAYNLWTESKPMELVLAALASSALPFIFPHQKDGNGGVYMDGGTVWNTNIISAIQRCKETVDDDSQIEIDIVTCQKQNKVSDWDERGNTINNYLRYQEIHDADQALLDIYDVMHAFPKVNFRHYVSPSKALKGGINLIRTDNKTITWPYQVLGRKDGYNEVKSRSGFNSLIDYVETNILKKKPTKKEKNEQEDGTVDLEFVQK